MKFKWLRVVSLSLVFACSSCLSARGQTISNATFLADRFPVWPGYAGAAGNPNAITAWINNRSGFGVNDRNELVPPFADNGITESGAGAAFLQGVGTNSISLTTAIHGLDTGRTYTLRFRANTRAAFVAPGTSPDARVKIGGRPAVTFVAPTVDTEGVFQSLYNLIETGFTATSEVESLVIENRSTNDVTLLIDDFRVNPVDPAASFFLGTNGQYAGGFAMIQTYADGQIPSTPVFNVSTGWTWGGWSPPVGPLGADTLFSAWYWRSQFITDPEANPGQRLLGMTMRLDGDAALAARSNFGATFFKRQSDGTWVLNGEIDKGTGSFARGHRGSNPLGLLGDTAVIGASLSRLAYRYQRQPDGSWIEAGTLAPVNRPADSNVIYLATGVALTDTNVFLVSPLEKTDLGSFTPGKVYVFERSGTGWVERAPMVPTAINTNETVGPLFEAAGDTAIVSMWSDDFGLLPQCRFIEFQRDSGGSWNEVGPVPAGGLFASMDFDGEFMALGHPYAHPGDSLGSNRVRVLRRLAPGQWITVADLRQSLDFDDAFGRDVRLSGALLAVAAQGDRNAYLYRRIDPEHWVSVGKVGPQGPEPTGGWITDHIALSGNWLMASDFQVDLSWVEFKEISVFKDSDHDGLDDNWEVEHFGSIAVRNGSGDAEGDDVEDIVEQAYQSDPNQPDTDADHYPDWVEIKYLMNPNASDAVRFAAAVDTLKRDPAALNLEGPLLWPAGGMVRFGFQIQETPSISSGSWSNVDPALEVDVPAPNDRTFYRILFNGTAP